MSDNPRVFISYARQDGEEFAKALHQRIKRDEPEIKLWQDRTELEGGVGWWRQITEAIDMSQFVVLVMTPAAIRSSITRKEWHYARQQGICVYPVKGVPDAEIDYVNLPRWMSKAHFFDLDREWQTFINYLKSPCQVPRVPFMAPDLPDGFVERPELFERLKLKLLHAGRPDSTNLTALYGAGGTGKTTLALALCHYDETIATFDDGILWLTLGKNPNVLEGLTKIYAALTGERPGFVDQEDAAFYLSERLEGKNCLIVLDDVWDVAHLRPFMRGGKDCMRLVITRIFDIASSANNLNVAEMSSSEAVAMLTMRMENIAKNLTPFRELAERLHRWPLLLELASATLRHRISRGDDAIGALTYLKKKLDIQGVVAFDSRKPVDRHQAIAKTIEVSLELLDESERECCAQLAIFPEDVDVPLSVVNTLWELDEFDSEELAQRLDNLSLLKFSIQAGTIRLHDLVRGYLTTQLLNPQHLHSKIVNAWGDPYNLPHTYAWRWLAYHLSKSDRNARLRELLFDFEWIRAKLDATDTITLISDYDLCSQAHEDLDIIRGAIQLSAHVLASQKSQLAGQLLARLDPNKSHDINSLCEQAKGWRGALWLRPLIPILVFPGGALIFTLAGHTGRVRSVGITKDSQYVVSASDDNTIKVWNLSLGVEERTLSGHSDWVRAVAVLSDKFQAISASDDQTIKLWDIASGALALTIDTQGDWIRALVVTPDERFAITASDHRTIRLWDLSLATITGEFEGHTGSVNTLAVTPNGRFLVSGSDDRTVRVWDLDHKVEVSTLRGHRAKVNAVAVTTDGNCVISASADDTIRLWDLNRVGSVDPRIVSDRAYGVRNLAVVPNQNSIITASEDYTLKVFGIDDLMDEKTLEGHTDWVNDVAVTPDGKTVVSASDDRTLKVWSLQRGAIGNTQKFHTDRVRAVIITPDGRYAVSTSDDRSLRIWDMALAAIKQTHSGHNNWVMSVTPDSRRIISAAGHNILRVKDLETGEEYCKFMKHTDRIRAVTVTPDGTKVISAGDDRTIRIWNIGTGSEMLRIDVKVHWIRALAVTPDGKYILSASDRRTLKLWAIENGSDGPIFRGHTARVNSVAITSDGRLAVSASDDHSLRVWNLKGSNVKLLLQGHTAKVNAVAIFKDAPLVISASDDYTLRIWNIESGLLINSFTGESPFLTVAVNSLKRTVVAGDLLGNVHFFRLEGLL